MVSIQYPDTGPGRGGPGVSARLVACPECELPAEITERFWLDSTDGPVLHVCVTCVDGHYFRMPADRLLADVQPAMEPTGAGQPGRGPAGTFPPGTFPPDAVPADTGDHWAPASRVGLARLPGRLGTVATVMSDAVWADEATASLA
jgi:hypothetical protein